MQIFLLCNHGYTGFVFVYGKLSSGRKSLTNYSYPESSLDNNDGFRLFLEKINLPVSHCTIHKQVSHTCYFVSFPVYRESITISLYLYSWIDHGLQSGTTLAFSLWLSNFKTGSKSKIILETSIVQL